MLSLKQWNDDELLQLLSGNALEDYEPSEIIIIAYELMLRLENNKF